MVMVVGVAAARAGTGSRLSDPCEFRHARLFAGFRRPTLFWHCQGQASNSFIPSALAKARCRSELLQKQQKQSVGLRMRWSEICRTEAPET